MDTRDPRDPAIQAVDAIGLQATLSRISEIRGALAPSATQAAATSLTSDARSGDASSRAFGDALAQSALRALADPAGDATSEGTYGSTALGSSGLSALTSALAGTGGQGTVPSSANAMTLPAGTQAPLPADTGQAGVGWPPASSVPQLPLPASANAVGGPGTAGPLGQRIAAIASAELGVAESPPGSNDAPRIAEYRTATAGSSPAPWCAYFCSWVARQAGVPIGEGGRGEGWVPGVKQWGQQTGRYIEPGAAPPQAGDLVVFDRGGDGVLDHIGIVTGVAADGSISTVEGNSSNAVSARRYGPGEYAGLVRLTPPGI